ncbi:MAG: HPr kinase/phosphorylase [Ignavibacteriales bacterium]|jgi:HPr kinase/phosphorylase|nr:HPr(Ser) kinase/phosphatase [Ignavibacteriaceae bacterium]NLH60596.1 HPr kinase/phosphorylase [Ignavibacteriales bacterium]HOJ17425.1 HPr(Ser) kinase/phosphatase [Ignavibacteriaceae bacterium]HPO54713.1 HPr(Ser) kinase/phosphatase [Ignavibacteriaceae bacterium]
MISIDNNAMTRKESIDVRFFHKITEKKFGIHLLTGEGGLDRKIKDQNLHRPGLALAGFVDLFAYSRVQVFGNTEIKYLGALSLKERRVALEKILKFEIPCIILTNDHRPSDELLELANKFNTPVFGSKLSTTKLSNLISDFLDDQFAPRLSIHGSFVDVYGVGILFVGNSGIGKSEIALDLIERGHRLVADDVVILTKKAESIILGAGTELVKHFMEIRGIGFIDVEKMFGVRAIRYQKRLEVIVELEVWSKDSDYTRTGLEDASFNILGVDLPYVRLPIVPGKNITVISEVIALHYLLKHYDYDAAKVFQNRLKEAINRKYERNIDYFEHDFE